MLERNVKKDFHTKLINSAPVTSCARSSAYLDFHRRVADELVIPRLGNVDLSGDNFGLFNMSVATLLGKDFVGRERNLVKVVATRDHLTLGQVSNRCVDVLQALHLVEDAPHTNIFVLRR